MAVVIRLSRHGKKNDPFYRVVAADKRYPKEGRFIEVLGTYNPRKKAVQLNRERVDYWLSKGASASSTVSVLIAKAS